MRTRLQIVALGLLTLAFGACEAFSQVHVRGYVRSDGTYVPPHARSSPDGNPYNNYGYPGNINPFTGKVATGDPLAYLERYYRTRLAPRALSAGATGAVANHELPSDLVTNLVPLPGAVPVEELDRARAYCKGTSRTVDAFDRCIGRQSFGVAGLALPDYRTVPQSELARGAAYCERLYGDDRAGFYNCLNRQVIGLASPPADLSFAPDSDRQRATRYCNRLYGDDRAGNASCMQRQVAGLASPPADLSFASKSDRERATRYCSRLYDDDRAGNGSCMQRQAASIPKGHAEIGTDLPPVEWQRAARYCERLYGDDRGGYSSCVLRQQESLRTLIPETSTDLPNDEWSRALRFCDRLYGDDRAGANACRSRQHNGIASRREPVTPERAPFCERLYSDDRAGYWACVARVH